MATYRFRARDAQGHTVQETIVSDSRYDALAQLKGRGLTVLELEDTVSDRAAPPPVPPRRRAPAATDSAPEPTPAKAPRKGMMMTRVRLGDIAILCRQLAISVSSGVPMRDALESIAEDLDHPYLKKTLSDVIEQLHSGSTFSDALARHSEIFDKLFISLVRSAEESGAMTTTLEQLADGMERSERLSRKIVSITAYPVFIVFAFVLVVVIMTFFVLPQFQDSFSSMGAALPPLTRIVFGINQFMLDNVLLIVAGIAALSGLAYSYTRTRAGRMRLDRLKLKMPFFGTIIQKIAVTRVCRNMSIMIRGGVPIATSLEIVAGIAGNSMIEAAILRVRDRIMAGADFSSGLAREDVFPRLVVRMVGVGESSGRLPEVMDKVADAYEDQVEGAITVATSLFEPFVIVFFGMIILILILAIYMPVFTIGRVTS